ncbi:MAG: DUF1295 domain-containing protein [Dehalococcoidia bacterium]|nr:DUF1295 domain-containing protein [Dehalococcoidia bacterium]
MLFFDRLLHVSFLFAGVVFVVLLRIPAPYGRHLVAGWGPTLAARTGWLLMEAPASVLFMLWFLLGAQPPTAAHLVFLVLWETNYVHRAFIYPFTLRKGAAAMPVAIVLSGMVFNAANAYLNGRWLFTFSARYEADWLLDPRFLTGVILFGLGFAVNRYADGELRRARLLNGQQYCRLDRGVFRYVCCPNYLGEMLMWFSWAFSTWSLAGLSFALWTTANLAPRARAHRRWCRTHFEGYPEDRKALIPRVW